MEEFGGLMMVSGLTLCEEVCVVSVGMYVGDCKRTLAHAYLPLSFLWDVSGCKPVWLQSV